MKVVHKHRITLDERQSKIYIDVMQADANTRVLEFSLYSGGTAWNVPDGVSVAIAYCGASGRGAYDTLQDGTVAYTVAGNVVTVVVTPQAIAMHGDTDLTIVFTDGNGKQLSPFCVTLAVKKNPAVNATRPPDYINLRQWMSEELLSQLHQATAQAIEAKNIAGAAASGAQASKAAAEESASSAGRAANSAIEAAERAVEAADQVDIEHISALVDAKADDMYLDPDTNLLYLVSNGQQIGSGIPVSTGSGGGGGSASTYTMALNNMLPSRVITVSEGTKVELVFSYSSADDAGINDGPGVGKIIIGNVTKLTFSAVQGGNIQDITPYLSAGTNNVKVQVENSEGAKKTLPYTVTVAAAHLTSSFDTAAPFTDAITFPYTPTGLAEKTMHFEVDGAEIGTAVVTTSGRQQSYTIPAQSHGAHTIRAWFDCKIDGMTVTSNVLSFQMICTKEGNTTKIISVDFSQLGNVEQFSNIVTKYRVYDPESLTASVTLEANGEVISTQTVDRTEQVWTYRPTEVGELVQAIRSGDVSAHWSRTVTKTSIPVEAETEALALHLSSYGRSNNEADRNVWESGNISCVFQNFNFTSDGWLIDDAGNTVCRVTGDARLQVPYKMFAYDFRTTGKTIEFELATREVLDYDAEIINCFAGGRGFAINAQQLRLASEQSSLGARYKEDEHIRVTFVVQKKSAERLILCYINGIMSSATQYPGDDDFSQPEPVDITIGSNDCTVDLYNIRVYDNDISPQQVLDNWIADTRDPEERVARYLRNQIYDVYGSVVISKLPSDLCYLVLECPELPQYKGDKKACSGYFVDLVHPERSFSFKDAEIDVQGTSSQYYWRKNYKIKFKGGFILTDGTTVAVYAMNEDAIPVSTFTMKADVASSEGYYNVVTAQLFNKYHPLREEGTNARFSIDGFPIVIFWNDGNTTKFLGKYNFNNDKGTPEPFGLVEGDERWEVLQNGTARVGFHNADFSDDSWKEDFEGNYPDKNTDLTNLQPMCAWVTSTDTEQATGENGDTAESRLAKFDAELAAHFVESAVNYYYIFTEAFLCMDQREKNVLWRYIKEIDRWIADYYDADSIIGHNNQAQPVFDYWMEDIDYTASGDPVYNGQNSTFWKNLRATRYDELKDTWHELRGKGFSYDSIMEAFAAHKSKWPEAIYNEDMQCKCLDPLTEAGDGTYLPFLLGDKWSWTQQFMYKRFRYLDSKYEYGSSLENRATIRTNVMVNLILTYYMKMYGHVYYNAEHIANRVEKDTPCEFVSHASGAEDRVIGINDADMITSLGDLSGHQVELINLSKMIRLRELKLGDGAADYVNNSLTTVTFGNNILLRKADLRNCAALTQAVDMSGCTNVEEIYFDGSSITGLKLPNGGVLKKLHLPGTVTNLTLRNQTKLEEFVIPSYSQITTLWLENNSEAVDAFEILDAIPANSRVRIIGFDKEMTNSELAAFLDNLDVMRGLDESGNNTDLAQVGGRIYLEEVNGTTLSRAEKYVGLTVEYGSVYLNSTRLVERTLSGDYTNDRVTSVGPYAFAYNTGELGVVSLPNVTDMITFNDSGHTSSHAFCGISSIDKLSLPKIKTVYRWTLKNSVIRELELPSVTTVKTEGFSNLRGCSHLRLPAVTSIGAAAIDSTYINGGCLVSLILPGDIVCALGGTLGYSNHVFGNGNVGHIYVPRALIEDYKVATNWSAYADQFRALEDYTVDGTVNGELDETKI